MAGRTLPWWITHDYLVVGEGADGQPLRAGLFRVHGKQAEQSPRVYIQASIHAAEVQGNAVIEKLLGHFSSCQPDGDVVLVPQCNPLAVNNRSGSFHQGRFDPAEGANWNRYYYQPDIDYESFVQACFSSSYAHYTTRLRNLIRQQLEQALDEPLQLNRAQRLAYTLQYQALEADIVLDLHTDTNSVEYLYVPAYARHHAGTFGFPYALVMDNEFGGALDEAACYPWWTLQQRLAAYGRNDPVAVESFTLELGEDETINSNRADRQAGAILNYLAARHVVNDKPEQVPQYGTAFYPSASRHTLYAPYGGLYEWWVAPGTVVEQGQQLGRCLQMNGLYNHAIRAPYEAVILSIHSSGALPQGTQVMIVVQTS